MATEGHGLKHDSILASETQVRDLLEILFYQENNNCLDLSTPLCSLTAISIYWSYSMLKLISDLSDILIGVSQWLWSLEECWFIEAVLFTFRKGGTTLQQQELSEGRVSGCHSFPGVPLCVSLSNSWGQMFSDVLYPGKFLLFWEQKQVRMSFWICICNAPSMRIPHPRLSCASDLWKIWISKYYCKECCIMLMTLILSIILKHSFSWQVSLNKCTLQLDPAKRISSMS